MAYHELDTVVLTVDLPAYSLKRGDLGTVVQVYSPDAVEAEFVTATGKTQAVITLRSDAIRPVRRSDLLAVRQLDVARQTSATGRVLVEAMRASPHKGVDLFAHCKGIPGPVRDVDF